MLKWPEENGVRADLRVVPEDVAGSTDWDGRVRYGFSMLRIGAEAYRPERYVSNFKGDIERRPTSDVEGARRLMRAGDTINSYH